jgi:hypothetical protein
MGGGRVTVDPYGRVISATAGATAATASQMEDRSSTAVYVTPVQMKDHLGVAKFWVAFDGSGTASIAASYNVASVVRSAAGIYTVNFNTGFANANYVALPSTDLTTGGNAAFHLVPDRQTGSCQIRIISSGGGNADCAEVMVTGFGYHST